MFDGIDWVTLVNWFVFYLLVPFIGAGGGYLLQRQRDNVAWKREKEKLRQEYQRNIDLLRHQVEQELYKQQQQRLRSEILPSIWQKIINAFEKAHNLADPKNQVLISFSQMSDEQLTRFLGERKLTDYEKQSIIRATDRTAKYALIENEHRVSDAAQARAELNDYFLMNKFSIEDELYLSVMQIDACIGNAIGDVASAIIAGNTYRLPSIYNELCSKSAILFPQIEKHIRQHVNS